MLKATCLPTSKAYLTIYFVKIIYFHCKMNGQFIYEKMLLHDGVGPKHSTLR